VRTFVRVKEEDKMRHTIWTLLLVITVGVLAFAAGRNTQTTTGVQGLSVLEVEQPRVVLVKTEARKQKDARQYSEGCQVIPNGEVGQPKVNEEERRLMKGLVF
jgi:hypothetical protein